MAINVPKQHIKRSHKFKDMTNRLVGERSVLLDAKTIKLMTLEMVPNTHTKESREATAIYPRSEILCGKST